MKTKTDRKVKVGDVVYISEIETSSAWYTEPESPTSILGLVLVVTDITEYINHPPTIWGNSLGAFGKEKLLPELICIFGCKVEHVADFM